MKKPIIIQGALQSEINFLLEKLENKTEIHEGNFVFYEGTYRDYPIVISKTKMGEISSAISTTLSIKKYNPLCIINQGTAGALVDWLNIGDIVIGNEFYYLSQYSTDCMKEVEDINPWKKSGYKTIDNEFVSYNANEKFLDCLKNLEFLKSKNVYFGSIGSGDIWTKEIETMHQNHKNYGVLCEAMEVSGAYISANSLDVPLVSIRVIANNEITHQEYDEKYGIITQEYTLNILDELIKLIK